MDMKGRKKTHSLVVISFALLVGLFVPYLFAETPSQEASVYYSWDVFEPDKCAAIWLLKRFVQPGVRIQIVPKGKTVPNATPFDIPMAKFRRYHNLSTFEVMLGAFNITDPRLVHIGQIMHDIEINIWEKKKMRETRVVQDDLNEMISKSVDHQEIIARSCDYFDRLYESILIK